jgi:hypothetical protein
MLAPTWRLGDIVIMDNLAAHKVAGVRQAVEACGAELRYLAALQSRPQSDRKRLRQVQGACAQVACPHPPLRRARFCSLPVAFARSLRKNIGGFEGMGRRHRETNRCADCGRRQRSGPGLSGMPKGRRKKKSRKLSRARSRRHTDFAEQELAPSIQATSNDGPSGKLRGPFYARALRARWHIAPASRVQFRFATKKSRAAPKDVVAGGRKLMNWAVLKAQQLRETLGGTISQNNVSKPPAVIETAGEIISSSEPIRQGALPVIDHALAAPAKKKWWRDDRVPIARAKLELAIAEAVKEAAPGCEAFVGVIIQHSTPRSRFDANWALRGVKFGKAARETVNEALATIVERMQREFRLSEE